MTSTKNPSNRTPNKAVPIVKETIKVLTRGRAMKHNHVDPEADFLHKQKLATATVRQYMDAQGHSSSTISATKPSAIPSLTLDSQERVIENGQETLSFISSSLPEVPPSDIGETSLLSLPDFALDMQKQLRAQNQKFEAYEARFSAMEAIIQENITLKANTTALESTIREQAARIKQLEHNLNSPVPHNERMEIDLTRDTSTNASIWAKVPSTKTTTNAPFSVSVKKSTQGLTAAQVVALNAAKPLKKKTPVKKPTSETITQAARPFLSVDPNTPQGFKYIYLGRSRKITRAETRKRFKTVGINEID